MKSRLIKLKHVSPGIAIGRIFKMPHRPLALARTWIRDERIDEELLRFEKAVEKTAGDLAETISKLYQDEGDEKIKIIESHKLILEDKDVIDKVMDEIRVHRINSEWALDKVISEYKLAFANAPAQNLREKMQDMEHIVAHILKNLMGHAELPINDLPQATILLAPNISPADVVNLPKLKVKGFIVEAGSETSHNAIVARSLEIPAAFGLTNAMDEFEDGEEIILDASNKVILASPPLPQINRYVKLQEQIARQEEKLLKEASMEARTSDKKIAIPLKANIELIEEVASVKIHGAEGIGLYRTEYLFINRTDIPSEREQFENYSSILKQMQPLPVTIRTFDMGGDKLPECLPRRPEKNPAMGLRGIRLALEEKNLFKSQLKALLKASVTKNLNILLPLISGVDEFRQAKKIFEEVKKDLARQNIKTTKIKLGVMIELPSAAMMAADLAKEADFFSIGTNDLIQYGLGIDRGNEFVSHMYNHFDPFVLRMIDMTIAAARKEKIECYVCGEMAGDALAAPLFVGWKIDGLSMNPVAIPHVKKEIRSLDSKRCKKLLRLALSMKTAKDVEDLLKKESSRKNKRK